MGGVSSAQSGAPSSAHAICQQQPSGRSPDVRGEPGGALATKVQTRPLDSRRRAPASLSLEHLAHASHPAPAPQAPHHPNSLSLRALRRMPVPAATYLLPGDRLGTQFSRHRPPGPADLGPRPCPAALHPASAAPPRASLGRANTETLNTEDAQRRARGATQGPAPCPRASAPLAS